MKQNKRMSMGAVWVACLCLLVQAASANNLKVSNVSLVAGDAGYSYVQADISWDNSWKASWTESSATITNWDAAWVFVKFRTVGVTTGDWSHASLSTNASDHVCTNTATINVGVSTNAGTPFGCGVFLYRSAEDHGSWTNTVKLRWNYAVDGLSTASKVDVNVLGIEMVYVPQGSFKVGSGGTESGSFTEGNAGTTWVSGSTPSTVPFAITSEGALTITNTAGNLWGTSSSSWNTIGSAGTLPPEYPKGFNGFYCMKYEISQGQWVGFFNMLTDSQKPTRDITAGTYNNTGKGTDAETSRNTVSWIGLGNDATNTTPDRACNFLNWADVAAYADWAGLRPMTELEFEKACRGPLNPVANEYAWGNTTISATTAIVNDGTGLDTATGGNCNYNTCTPDGPYRVGIYAIVTSDRTAAGATYWGIMEMSGNVWERAVSVYEPVRTFAGAVGNGVLNSIGNADADLWPSTSANGVGVRGGRWASTGTTALRTSAREYAAYIPDKREYDSGGRAVRQAPSGLQ